MPDPLLILSATELARRIREGDLSARQVTDAHIDQIERVNPTLNALVRDRFAEARTEADAADARQAEGVDLGALHGVPCTIKECFAFTGMPNASGLVARKDVVSTEDATAVARLRAAGAIPMGVTNTSELCMWMESNNYLYGRTNNPYDPTRIVGGSSGGEGALVAAGASPFGLGSDIGGSIRLPAFFNGVFGHKPTGGLVPGTGQYPDASPGAARYLTTGPLCRRAEDLMPLLRLLAGPDGHDPGAYPMQLGDPAAVELRGRPVVSIEGNGAQPVSGELVGAQRRAADALAARGCEVRTVALPSLKRGVDMWSACMQVVNEQPFGTLMGQGTPISPVWELMKWSVGQSEHTAMASLLALTEPMLDWFPATRDQLVQDCDALREEVVELIGPDGLLLYPTYPRVAPKHNSPLYRAVLLRWEWAYTALINVLELPITQTPLGLNAQGLPLGVQVGAVHGRDHLTIAAAMALEAELGGWVPPKTMGF